MAIQTGNIKYRGSFKNIRQYRTLHDPNSYAGEKGGANRDLIMNNPAFARTRENMNEFNGCGVAVKAIRYGLLNLLPEQTDKYFTARMMRVVKQINLNDPDGVRGKRSILFSENRGLLLGVIFNKLESIADIKQKDFIVEHPVSRAEATLTLTDLTFKPVLVPKGATHFRVQNHLSVISDYTYSEINRRYEPLSELNTMSAFGYSEYTDVKTPLSEVIVVSFPVGTTLSTDDTVIQSVGIEFYQKVGASGYSPLKGSSMRIVEVF